MPNSDISLKEEFDNAALANQIRMSSTTVF
jgi:hypothetical protein